MIFQATAQNVNISGRTLFIDGTRYLSYTGSFISFTFIGKAAKAVITSDSPDWDRLLKGWIAIYVNDEKEPRQRICLDHRRKEYTLYECETTSEVTVHIVKYSEAAFGSCGIESIEIDTEELLPAKEHMQRTGWIPDSDRENVRRIEIIGDSITCGYGNEAENELCPFDTAQENPTLAYSLKTIKALGAEGHLVSWSGIGMISNWVPEDATQPLDEWLMPMLYQYTDASMSKRIFGDDASKWEKWDFTHFVPDVIVINIGTNDCSYCKEIPERNALYGDAYEKFVDFVTEHNPKAQILCILGLMDQRLNEELEKVVARCQQKGLSQVHFLPLPIQLDADGKGADYHPSPVSHEKAAKLVVQEIRKIMNWDV